MDDDQNAEPSDDSKKTVIVNRHFGIANEKTIDEDSSVKTPFTESCNDIIMDEVHDIQIDNDKLCEKNDHKITNATCEPCEDNVEKSNSPIEDIGNNFFGSSLLNSKSVVSNQSELPSSFATVSENYEKLKKDNVLNESAIISENKSQSTQGLDSDQKSTVVLAKGNLPSTLSMISANYQDSSSDDDSDTSSEPSVDTKLDDDSDNENSIISSSFLKEEPIKTKGELDISDLPPIEDLKISVDEEKCQPVGNIKSIVDTLVIVEAFLNQPALDIDSVLFVDRGQRALGKIFDVFGPVSKPFYAVRFNDSDHIKKFDVQIKEPVYCAPQTEYASFVLVSQLLQMKGSDASWRHNNEPPCELLDYSDDEAEQLAKRQRKLLKKSKLKENNTDDKQKSPDPSNQNANARSSVRSTADDASPSSFRNSNWEQRPYSPRPPHPPNYNHGPRHFPTYAQQLSSMDYSRAYRQPYNPWYYDQTMYPPRHSYPYQQPPYMPPPGYDYRPQHRTNQSSDPNRYPFPDHNPPPYPPSYM